MPFHVPSFRLPQSCSCWRMSQLFYHPEKNEVIPYVGGERSTLFLPFLRNWVDICTFLLLDLGLRTGGSLITSTSIIARAGSAIIVLRCILLDVVVVCVSFAPYTLLVCLHLALTKWCRFYVSLLSLPRLSTSAGTFSSLGTLGLGGHLKFTSKQRILVTGSRSSKLKD